VSSRTRPRAGGFGRDEVVEHRAVDDVGESALEAAHGFVRGFPSGDLAVEVRPAFRGITELDYGHHVQRLVDLAVAAAGEPMPHVVAGGRVDGGGSGPGREVTLGREPGDVTDLDQQPRRPGWADGVQVD